MAVQAVLEEYIYSDLSNVVIDYIPEFELINHKIIDFGYYPYKDVENSSSVSLILDNKTEVYISTDRHDPTWFTESASRGTEYVLGWQNEDSWLLGAKIINIVNIPYNTYRPEFGNVVSLVLNVLGNIVYVFPSRDSEGNGPASLFSISNGVNTEILTSIDRNPFNFSHNDGDKELDKMKR